MTLEMRLSRARCSSELIHGLVAGPEKRSAGRRNREWLRGFPYRQPTAEGLVAGSSPYEPATLPPYHSATRRGERRG